MVILIGLAILLQQPLFIALLWAIQVISLWQGMQANLLVQLAAPLLRRRAAGAPTESRELLRFNGSIAVGLLTLSIFLFWLRPDSWVGYLFAGMVAAASLLAICGFCVGCFLYYQLKRVRR